MKTFSEIFIVRTTNAKRVRIRYGIKATPTMVYNGLHGSRYRQVEDLVVGKGASANEVLPIVGKTKGYESQTTRISTGAENVALYPKLKDQLIQENFRNISSQDPRLKAVYEGLGKGLNYGIKGNISSSESDRLGRLWVGEGYSELKDSKGKTIGYNSQDRLRGYRHPSRKDSPYAKTGIQSNFETYKVNSVTNEKIKVGNAHFNIED